MTYTFLGNEFSIVLILFISSVILFYIAAYVELEAPRFKQAEEYFTPAMRLHSSIKGKEIISASVNNMGDLKLTLEDENHIISHCLVFRFNHHQKTNIDKIEIDVENETVYAHITPQTEILTLTNI